MSQEYAVAALARCARMSHLSVARLLSDDLAHDLRPPRKALLLALTDCTDWSNSKVARFLRRDPSTCRAMLRASRALYAKDADFARFTDGLRGIKVEPKPYTGPVLVAKPKQSGPPRLDGETWADHKTRVGLIEGSKSLANAIMQARAA